jgi:UDP-N-acetylmuramoylalanine--D-glutamate ligase
MTNRRNLVLGLGKTGVSVVRWLLSRGEDVTVNDSRDTPPGGEEIREFGATVQTRFGHFDHELLADVDRIIVSPGISSRETIVKEANDRGIPVVGDIEVFAEAHTAPVLAVTGTNGKSTVTTLLAEMIQSSGRTAYAGGNLGDPALDLLSRPIPDFYVLELSSYQLENTSNLKLEAAVVLNVTADHMDRYDSLADYAAAKARIFKNSRVAVLNADDAIVSSMNVGQARSVQFGITSPGIEYTIDRDWIVVADERLMPLADLGIPGMHNASNALAALAMGDAIGLPRESMVRTLRDFSGLPHRMQLVSEWHGVNFVDDSKGTNVGATVAAIAGLSKPVVLIAGGDGKGQDFSPLSEAFAGRVRYAVLLGRDREAIAAAVAAVCPTEYAADMDSAVLAAAKVAQPGDVVLLSPACASLDMYRNYAERGMAFATAARRLSA